MHAGLALSLAVALALPGSAQEFVNFESPQTHPIRLSADGARLFTVLTPEARLCVWSVADPSAPVLLAEVPVGLEPISVTPRNADEVWVVNWLSDSVSVVSLAEGRVVDTLYVEDEPADVAFAQGKAFVSVAASNEVRVFDAETRAPLGAIQIAGKDPRALAVSGDGATVYALVRTSGNGTTLLKAGAAPPPPPPENPALPPAPQVGLVVQQDDPLAAGAIDYTLDDFDLAEIDAASQSVTVYHQGLGTTNTDVAVHPFTGELFVSNTNARNTVRFEPNLRGHAVDSRVTRIAGGGVTAFDLNPGVDYGVLPNDAAKAVALADPMALALDPLQGRLFVAAQGTDRVAVLDLAGTILERIDVGIAPGAAAAPKEKRGPRGLALNAAAQRLYVLNRISQTISVVDTASGAVLRELSNGSHNATPPDLAAGRGFLYDAKLSGNGTFSCASCHVDAEKEGLAWDLGDPGGEMSAPPPHPDPAVDALLKDFHPMKGPMLTQTLRGLASDGPLHWRGDRATFQDFNATFEALMGGAELAEADMDLFAEFGLSIAFPPNPNQSLDRVYAAEPADANQATGLDVFLNNPMIETVPGKTTCNDCHVLPDGTAGEVVPQGVASVLSMRVPNLRNLYRRTDFLLTGFGIDHDGAVRSLEQIVALQVANVPDELQDDLVAFLLALDTGTAPAVGYQVTLDGAGTPPPAALADLALLEARAAAGDLDLVAKGRLFATGDDFGLLYDPAAGTYLGDVAGAGPYAPNEVVAWAADGVAALVFTATPPGEGLRYGIDRDLDGTLDGAEGVAAYGVPSPGCGSVPALTVSSEPYAGNESFAFVGTSAPGLFGTLVVGVAPTAVPVLGALLLVAPAPALQLATQADAAGVSAVPVPIPSTPETAGVKLYAQLLLLDACSGPLLAATAGLELTIQP